MQDFKLLVSISGRLSAVDVRAPSVDAAMHHVRNANPGDSTCLVRVL